MIDQKKVIIIFADFPLDKWKKSGKCTMSESVSCMLFLSHRRWKTTQNMKISWPNQENGHYDAVQINHHM